MLLAVAQTREAQMSEIREMITRLFERCGTLVATSLLVLIPIGWADWLWMAARLGSFTMLFLGILIPLVIFVAPIGLWSLLFGVPEWLVSFFG